MAANIAAVRALVRKDLHDEDAANYRWVDASLDRDINRAVIEYSLASPLEQKTTLTTTAGSRDLSVAGLVTPVSIDAVEWPTLQFPPARIGYSVWGTTLTMDVVAAPSGAENVFIYWTKLHTLDGS